MVHATTALLDQCLRYLIPLNQVIQNINKKQSNHVLHVMIILIRSIFKISGTFEVGGEWSSFKPATNFIARVWIKKIKQLQIWIKQDKTIAHFNIYFDRIEFECAIAKKYTSLKILTGWGLFVKIMHFITALKFFFFCFFLLQNVLPFSGSNCTLPSEDRILKRSCPALCPRKYQKHFVIV